MAVLARELETALFWPRHGLASSHAHIRNSATLPATHEPCRLKRMNQCSIAGQKKAGGQNCVIAGLDAPGTRSIFGHLRNSRGFNERGAGVRCQALDVQNVRGGISGEGLRFGVVVALFNDIVTKPLLSGALETFERHGVQGKDVKVVWVPGSFEIPVVAQKLARSGDFDAVLCVGAVVRGSTTHYDAVANSAASGVLSAGLGTGVPCIFGVLTCETMEQAMDRAGGKLGNKGSEAAVTAIEMASLFKKI